MQPARTCVTLVPAGRCTLTGTSLSVVVPSPSAPNALRPQARTVLAVPAAAVPPAPSERPARVPARLMLAAAAPADAAAIPAPAATASAGITSPVARAPARPAAAARDRHRRRAARSCDVRAVIDVPLSVSAALRLCLFVHN